MSDRLHAAGAVELRPMRPDDEPEVVSLLSRTLGWREDERHRELLSWKHRLNPFGESPAWVAEDDDGIAGFRTMMRWEFLVGGACVRAVRAVDTATHPRCQGRGIFKALTLKAIGDLEAEGTSWIFNTPNTQSAPGYLSMGWKPIGRVPVSIRPAAIAVLPSLLAERLPSDLWSVPTSVGEEAGDVLADAALVHRLLSSGEDGASDPSTVRTRRTAEFLLWRFGRCPVGYRALPAPGGIDRGFAVFRVRRRGAGTEVLLAEIILADPGDHATRRRLAKSVLHLTGADYGVALGVSRPARWLPAWGQGPLLTWRRLNWDAEPPRLSRWRLSSGDVELF